MRFIHWLDPPRLPDRFNCTVVVGDVFWYFKGQPVFHVVFVLCVVECVSWFFVRAGTTVVVRIDDDRADLRYLLYVGVAGAFRVDVSGGECDIMTGRRVHFASPGVPCQRASILFVGDGR